MLHRGGGGGRILLDPEGMRRSATVLRDAASDGRAVGSAVAGSPRPEMPAGIAERVNSGIELAAERLRFEAIAFVAGAEELVHRALWAEIAGSLAGGEELDGAQLRQFLDFMAAGTLLVYATDEQSRLAGEYLGRMFRDDFEQPERLVELARLLGPNAADEHFAGGFVEEFGAENFAEVPRVIQAIEWSQQLTFGMGMPGPHIRTDIAYDAQSADSPFAGNVLEDLLAPFSLALATATYAGTLTRTTEHEIANDDDTWAVAQLLHQGTFGTTFLLDCFQSGVVDRIVEEANLRRMPGGYMLGESYPLGALSGEGLPLDPKVLVMQALGRNPEAAALALGGDLGGVELVDYFGIGHELHEPPDLLLAFAEWEDDGRALGDTYAVALGELHEQGDHGRANGLAQRLVHELIAERADVDRPYGDAWPGSDALDGLTHGVSTILAEHHMDDLHLAGLISLTGDELGLEGSGLLGRAHDDGIHYSPDQMKWIVMEMLDDESARKAFFAGAAAYEAELILEHTAQPNNDTEWARQIGFFQGTAANAYEQTALDDVAEEQARQDQLFGLADGVMGAIPMGKAAGFLTGEALGLIQDQVAPSEQHARDENFEVEQQLRAGMVGSMASGVLANGHLSEVDTFVVNLEHGQTPGFEPSTFVDAGGGVVPFNDMSLDQKLTFLRWLESDDVRRGWIENAIEDAENAFTQRLQDN